MEVTRKKRINATAVNIWPYSTCVANNITKYLTILQKKLMLSLPILIQYLFAWEEIWTIARMDIAGVITRKGSWKWTKVVRYKAVERTANKLILIHIVINC